MREDPKRFLEDQDFTKEEFKELLKGFENRRRETYFREKRTFLRGKYYGDKVFTRGLIEFTNYCKNNCYYCGIRGGNKNVVRTGLRKRRSWRCCKEGYARFPHLCFAGRRGSLVYRYAHGGNYPGDKEKLSGLRPERSPSERSLMRVIRNFGRRVLTGIFCAMRRRTRFTMENFTRLQ